MKTKAVIYWVNPNKIINGTLFYCVEYFLHLNKYQNIKLVLFRCNQQLYNKIIDIFHEKYNYDHSLDNNIIYSEGINYFKYISNSLILDNQTYNKVKYFIKDKSLIFSHDTQNNLNDLKNEFYGFYCYQNFRKKTLLKLGFDFFQKPKSKGSKTYYSNLNFKYVNDNNGISKENNKYENVRDLCNKFVYIHTGIIETNNRLIPESMFYDKELEVIYEKDNWNAKNDSCQARYKQIQENKLHELWLTDDDILIKDFLNL